MQEMATGEVYRGRRQVIKEKEGATKNALPGSGLRSQVGSGFICSRSGNRVPRARSLVGGAGGPLRKRTRVYRGKIRSARGYPFRVRKISKYETLKADMSVKK